MKKSQIIKELNKAYNNLQALVADIDDVASHIEELMEEINEEDNTDDDSDGYY